MVTKFFLINQSNEHVETARQCAWLICLADLPAWLVCLPGWSFAHCTFCSFLRLCFVKSNQ